MSKDVMISLRPEWLTKILHGTKKIEVRKRAPLQQHPYRMFLYCTKGGGDLYATGIIGGRECYRMNGKVVGEVTVVSTTDHTGPWGDCTYGTCLTAKQLYQYQGAGPKLSFMRLENPILYDVPKELADFGLKRAPQSWCYLKEEEPHE